MKAGLDERGFRRKQYAEIEEDMFIRARNLFGEDINLSVRSPLGIFLRVIAWSIGLLWQLAEQVYNQGYLRKAEGVSLDYLVELANIKRHQAAKSQGEIKVYGQSNKLIKAGFLVYTAAGIKYKTLTNATIDSTGYTIVPIEAVEYGESGNVEAGLINRILNPETGITKVENPAETHSGRDIESDYELRNRYELSFANGGSATVDAIRAKVLSIPSVKSAIVLENKTMNEVNSIPPKSIMVVVQGGTDKAVAQAILDTKAAGIDTAGDVVQAIPDAAGLMKEIRFQRAKKVLIYIKITAKKSPTSNLTEDAIRQVVASYFNGLKMGQDVVYSKLLAYILTNVEGLQDIDISVSKTKLDYQKNNIEIEISEMTVPEITELVIS